MMHYKLSTILMNIGGKWSFDILVWVETNVILSTLAE